MASSSWQASRRESYKASLVRVKGRLGKGICKGYFYSYEGRDLTGESQVEVFQGLYLKDRQVPKHGKTRRKATITGNGNGKRHWYVRHWRYFKVAPGTTLGTTESAALGGKVR